MEETAWRYQQSHATHGAYSSAGVTLELGRGERNFRIQERLQPSAELGRGETFAYAQY